MPRSVEYSRQGVQLQQVLRALNSCVIVPHGSQPVPGRCGEPADAVYAAPEVVQDIQADFLRRFVGLMGKAHYSQISARDSAMADVLNHEYLSQLFIRPQWGATDGTLVRELVDPDLDEEMQTVAVWKRGWGSQQQEGLMLANKLDYLQQTAARNFIRAIQRPVLQAQTWGRAQRRKAVLMAKACVARAQARLPTLVDATRHPHLAAALSRVAGARLGLDGTAVPLPPPPSVPSALEFTHGGALRRPAQTRTRLAHLIIPPHHSEMLTKFERQWRVDEPARMSPKHIMRVTVSDAMGGDDLSAVRRRGLRDLLLGKLRLAEPTFQEILVLSRRAAPRDLPAAFAMASERTAYSVRHWEWRTKKRFQERLPRVLRALAPHPGAEPPPVVEPPYLEQPLSLRVYKHVPVPIWQVCFPFRKVAFRPLDLLKMDLMAVVGGAAILGQVLYGNHRDILQLVWISTLATQAMRVVLGYTRMYTYFEGYVHRQLHEKTVVSEDGIGQFLAAAAALQQYKQAAILYALLARGLPGRNACRQMVPSSVVTIDCEAVMAQAEALLEKCGEKVRYNLEEPLQELIRLGIVSVLHQDGPTLPSSSRIRCQVMAPEPALAELRKSWDRQLLPSSRFASPVAHHWRFSYFSGGHSTTPGRSDAGASSHGMLE